MAETPPAPYNHAHHMSVKQAATLIRRGAEQILLDLDRGHLVRSSGRKIAADVAILVEAIAELAEHAKHAREVAA